MRFRALGSYDYTPRRRRHHVLSPEPSGMDATRAFYDGVAHYYDLIYPDWGRVVKLQGEALDGMIAKHLGSGTMQVLDCSCGIGTQAIGLALAGHKVVGTDLSPESVERARAEAKRAGVEVRFEVCDLRVLEDVVPDGFDVVISCGDALPHLLSEQDLRLGLRSMVGRLREGGMILATTRDYDELLRNPPRATYPVVLGASGTRVCWFQLLEWAPDGCTYVLEHVWGQEGLQDWEFKMLGKVSCRAVLRRELTALLVEQGVESVEWLSGTESKLFQSTVMGLKRQQGSAV